MEKKKVIKIYAVDPETWARFERYCIHQLKLAPSTTEKTIRQLKHMAAYNVDLLGFNQNEIYTFFEEKRKEGVEPGGINLYVKAINRWAKFIGVDVHFTLYREYTKPIRVPTLQDVNDLIRYYSGTPIQCRDLNSGHVNDLIRYYSGRSKRNRMYRTVLVVLANTGIRNSELCGLKISNIDWEKMELLVYGKGGGMKKPRTVPVPRRVLEGENYPSIRNYINHWRPKPAEKKYADFLFLNQSGRPFIPSMIWKIVNEAAKGTGHSWIHPHSLRHFYATQLLRVNVNVRVVQQLLGHEKLETTARYLHVIGHDLQNAVERLPDVVGLKTGKGRKSGDVYAALSGNESGPGGIIARHICCVRRQAPFFAVPMQIGGEMFGNIGI